MEMSAWQWKQDVLETAENKFERRLAEEGAALRLETAAVRLEVAAVRLEIERTHASTLKWMFVQWLTLMLAIVGLAVGLATRI